MSVYGGSLGRGKGFSHAVFPSAVQPVNSAHYLCLDADFLDTFPIDAKLWERAFQGT